MAANVLPQGLEAAAEHIVPTFAAAVAGATGTGQRIGREQAVGVHRAVAGAVAVVAVGAQPRAGGAHGKGVAHRQVDGKALLAPIELGELRLHLGAGLLQLRALGAHVDDAAGGVLAEQRALGAAQHFDLFDVEHFQRLGLDVRDHEVVHGHAHVGIGVHDDRGLADAAHGKRGGVEARRLAGGEVRHCDGDVAQVAWHHSGHVFGAQRRDCHRRGLHIDIAAAGGGDQDLFQYRLAVGGLRRQLERCAGGGCQQHAATGRNTGSDWHVNSP